MLKNRLLLPPARPAAQPPDPNPQQQAPSASIFGSFRRLKGGVATSTPKRIERNENRSNSVKRRNDKSRAAYATTVSVAPTFDRNANVEGFSRVADTDGNSLNEQVFVRKRGKENVEEHRARGDKKERPESRGVIASGIEQKRLRTERVKSSATSLNNLLRVQSKSIQSQQSKPKRPVTIAVPSNVTIRRYDDRDESVDDFSISKPGPSRSYSDDGNSTISSVDTTPVTEKPGSKQMVLESFTVSKQTKRRIDHALSCFIATDLQPYSIVERNGFKKLIHSLNPSYKLPSRKTITTQHIPQLHRQTRDVIAKNFENIKYVSLTTDCWTSAANATFIALTAHYVHSFQIQSVCLGCYHLNENHTSENIANSLISMLAEWDIDDEKVIAYATDFGANVVLAIEILNKIHIPCFGHTVNTAVTHSLEIDELSEIIRKIKTIQTVFSHSWKINRELQQIQDNLNLPKRKIPSFSKTRWWSLLTLMNVIVEQQLALLSVLQTYSNGKYKRLILNNQEIDILKEVIDILNPVESICEHLSGEKFITASCILPIYAELMNNFLNIAEETQADTEIRSIKKTIMYNVLSLLRERYITSTNEKRKSVVSCTHETLLKCTFLDPRFKVKTFEEDIKEKSKRLILEDMNSLSINDISLKEPPRKQKKSGLAAIFKTSQGIVDREVTTENELSGFLAYPDIGLDDNPLDWWQTHATIFPKLSFLASRYLCIPATSVASERVFSRGGLIVTDNRSSLSEEHVEELIFLAMNKDFIPV